MELCNLRAVNILTLYNVQSILHSHVEYSDKNVLRGYATVEANNFQIKHFWASAMVQFSLSH